MTTVSTSLPNNVVFKLKPKEGFKQRNDIIQPHCVEPELTVDGVPVSLQLCQKVRFEVDAKTMVPTLTLVYVVNSFEADVPIASIVAGSPEDVIVESVGSLVADCRGQTPPPSARLTPVNELIHEQLGELLRAAKAVCTPPQSSSD